MGIGDRIRIAAEAKGLSLRQLAEATAISYSSLQNWIGGHREPRIDALVAIGSQLGISLDWLLTGEGPMFRGELAALAPAPSSPAHNPREEAILALFRSLTEAEQREIQDAAEEKKRLTVLEQRVQTLEAVVADIKRPA